MLYGFLFGDSGHTRNLTNLPGTSFRLPDARRRAKVPAEAFEAASTDELLVGADEDSDRVHGHSSRHRSNRSSGIVLLAMVTRRIMIIVVSATSA